MVLNITLFVLLIFALAYNFYLSRKKDARIQFERQRYRAASDQAFKISMDASQKLQRQKIHELDHLVQQHFRKNEFLNSILHRTRQIASNKVQDTPTAIAKISKMVEKEMNRKEDWQPLIRSFAKIHNRLFTTLKHRHPNLNDRELRLIVLIKMELQSKDIARLLSVSEDGVKKARYRLRKKMKLDPDTNMKTYLENLVQD